jgi:hypothetical protein
MLEEGKGWLEITSSHTLSSSYRKLSKMQKQTYQRSSRVNACAPGRRTIHPFGLSELPESLFGHRAYRSVPLCLAIQCSVLSAIRRERSRSNSSPRGSVGRMDVVSSWEKWRLERASSSAAQAVGLAHWSRAH